MTKLGTRPSVRVQISESQTSPTADAGSPEMGGLRYVLVGLLLVAKLGYLAWYYAAGINLNLGDTATYLDPESAELFYERSGITFAYVATILYSTPATRIAIELIIVAVICCFIVKMPTDRRALVATAVVMLPTSLAFMTVASKELLVFLLLVLAYRARKWIAFPAFVVAIILKPSFAFLALFPVVRRWGATTVYLVFSAVITGSLLAFYYLSGVYHSTFYQFHNHFLSGNLSYQDPGMFPISPLLRTVGLERADEGIVPVLLSASLLISTLFVAGVLIQKFGLFVGGGQYLLFLVAVLPYSFYNLGSAARYQVPLICCIVLNEMLQKRSIKRSHTSPR